MKNTSIKEQNPNSLESALRALAGAFLFGLGVVAIKEILGGD